MKQFASVHDVVDLDSLVAQAIRYKNDPLADRSLGTGKRIGLLFLNPSLRTRLSTQVAAQNLGMEAIVFNVGQDGWALEFEEHTVMNGTTVEHIKDAAPVLSLYFDILAIRTFPSLKDREADYGEHVLSQFIRYAGIPVVSLESATLHPLQSLADLITIQETWRSGNRPKIVLTWAPHVKPLPQCVANSFSEWMTHWGGCDFTIAHPEGMELADRFTKCATITHDQKKALREADYIYVKNWSSYAQYGRLKTDHAEWMLTQEHLYPSRNARVMHCLPVRRNVELSDEVLDGANSLVTQQAGNRVWAAQSVLSEILKKL